MKLTDIFVPNDTPSITYVDRSHLGLEQRLRDLCETPNVVVSISGPSKAGKTVLIKKVIDQDYLIKIPGAGISSPETLWDRALNWMGTPNEVTTSKSSTTGGNFELEGSGKVKVPLFSEGGVAARGGMNHSGTSEQTETVSRGGLERVIREIGKSDFVLFIDDFHYINASIREEVGRQIKAAAEEGVKILVASVPHRKSDVVRSNTELRGRLATFDIGFWGVEELQLIARRGFAALNADLAPSVERALAQESFGSPQLMQSICLNLCQIIGLRQPLPTHERVEVTQDDLNGAFEQTTAFTDFTKMFEALHTGAKTRGTERKIHQLSDGTGGDVYRAILLGMKSDPASLSMNYDEITKRVRQVCVGDPPVGSSITSALEQMDQIGEDLQPGDSPIAWDGDVLDVTDPYFLFYLRCSDKLRNIAKA